MGDEQDGESQRDQMIPRDRFDRVYAERADLKKQVSARDAQIADLQSQLEGHAPQLEELAKLQQLQGQWTIERSIMSAGITDPEGVDFTALAYQRLGDDPPPISEWLAARDELPRGVLAYMAEPAQPKQEPDQPKPKQPVDKTAAGGNPLVVEFTPEQIANMSPGEYRENRDAILAQRQRGR